MDLRLFRLQSGKTNILYFSIQRRNPDKGWEQRGEGFHMSRKMKLGGGIGAVNTHIKGGGVSTFSPSQEEEGDSQDEFQTGVVLKSWRRQ